ncbi:unnamed protein product [Euphydryas editha]|uniref:Uncharacterized protein n=1 Tax=Euphydryas editha TaxID=104508 RepID=A0AAU9U312_EUPED|nr:unnamed protein product [Euphydryas editha]
MYGTMTRAVIDTCFESFRETSATILRSSRSHRVTALLSTSDSSTVRLQKTNYPKRSAFLESSPVDLPKKAKAVNGGMVGLPPPPHARLSLFDSCHRKIRLISGGPVAFLGGLVA